MPFINILPKSGNYVDLGGELYAPEIDAIGFENAKASLLELAGYLENVEAPLRVAKRIAINDMKDRFQTETDPEGNKWHSLAEKYSEWKVRHRGDAHPILTLDGDLKKAATKSSAWSVSADSLFINTSQLPEYWSAHQFGDGYGDFFHTGNADTAHLPNAEGTHNLPPRPFIGLSANAVDDIIDAFDLWFEEGLNLAVSGSGTVQTRTSLGRFGPKPIIS